MTISSSTTSCSTTTPFMSREENQSGITTDGSTADAVIRKIMKGMTVEQMFEMQMLMNRRFDEDRPTQTSLYCAIQPAMMSISVPLDLSPGGLELFKTYKELEKTKKIEAEVSRKFEGKEATLLSKSTSEVEKD